MIQPTLFFVSFRKPDPLQAELLDAIDSPSSSLRAYHRIEGRSHQTTWKPIEPYNLGHRMMDSCSQSMQFIGCEPSERHARYKNAGSKQASVLDSTVCRVLRNCSTLVNDLPGLTHLISQSSVR